MTSDLTVPKLIASTEVSATQVNTTEVSASAGHFTDLVVTGTARVTQDLAVSGKGTFGGVATGYVSASAINAPIMDGPVQVGPSGSRGRLVLCLQAEISGNNTKKSVTLPGGSDIIDIKYIARSPLSASAASTVDILVGTSADDVKLARFTNVSGMAYRTLANDVDVSGLASVSGASAVIVVGATAVSGAIASAARGLLNVVYVQKQ